MTQRYQDLAARTESTLPSIQPVYRMWRIQHAALGIATEAGEILDALKKHLYYGDQFDQGNLIEELGDVLWYVALMCNAMGWDIQDVMDSNIRKLKARYPEKFTSEAALNRDLNAEREAMG